MNKKGFQFNVKKCDDRYRSLSYRYRQVKDSNHKTGRGNTRWVHYDLMGEVLASDPAITPMHVLASIPSGESFVEVEKTLRQKPTLPQQPPKKQGE